MPIAPNPYSKDRYNPWLRDQWLENRREFEKCKGKAPRFMRDPQSVCGMNENSSTFKVVSNRDLMEFYIFPRCHNQQDTDIKLVCKAWAKWWNESQEYVDEHPKWRRNYHDFWNYIRHFFDVTKLCK